MLQTPSLAPHGGRAALPRPRRPASLPTSSPLPLPPPPRAITLRRPRPAHRLRLSRRATAESPPGASAPPSQAPLAPPPPPEPPHGSSTQGDTFKAVAVLLSLLVAAGALSHDWVGEHEVRARVCRQAMHRPARTVRR